MALRRYLCIFLAAGLLLPRETLSFLTGNGSPFPLAPFAHSSNYGRQSERLRTALRWSRQGHLESDQDDDLHCFDCGVVSTSSHRTLDLSIPRDWLESLPDGAYTVVRCDYRGNEQAWIIWGQEYHTQRIKDSFNEYLEEPTPTEGMELQSHKILHGLLKEAAKVASSFSESTFMVTLLCHPCERHGYRIRGHICSVDLSDSLPEPVTISVAVGAAAQQLPDRLAAPRAKLSRWCRDRRLLEELFKRPDISEVILVQRQQHSENHRTMLLEGLTSNLFVIRKDGVLQTTKENVLYGYARHLVIQHAQRLGLTVFLEPPQLEDCDTWEGVFLTSSVKLVVPVCQIVHPRSEDHASMGTLWSSRSPHRLCGDLFEAISKR